MWELDYKESWTPKNWCFWTVVLKKTLESSLDCKEISVLKENHPWIFIGRTDAEAKAPILRPTDAKKWLWKRHWCWARLKAGGEGDDRGWNGWMASLTQWTWVWAGSRSWWWTGKPGVLQSMGSQSIGHDWVTELNWNWMVLNTAISSLICRILWPSLQSTWIGKIRNIINITQNHIEHYLVSGIWLVDGNI